MKKSLKVLVFVVILGFLLLLLPPVRQGISHVIDFLRQGQKAQLVPASPSPAPASGGWNWANEGATPAPFLISVVVDPAVSGGPAAGQIGQSVGMFNVKGDPLRDVLLKQMKLQIKISSQQGKTVFDSTTHVGNLQLRDSNGAFPVLFSASPSTPLGVEYTLNFPPGSVVKAGEMKQLSILLDTTNVRQGLAAGEMATLEVSMTNITWTDPNGSSSSLAALGLPIPFPSFFY